MSGPFVSHIERGETLTLDDAMDEVYGIYDDVVTGDTANVGVHIHLLSGGYWHWTLLWDEPEVR